MLLDNQYDHRQMWLPIFGETVYFKPIPVDTIRAPDHTPMLTNMSWSRDDIPSSQEVFAFDSKERLSSSKKISLTQFKLLEAYDYPTFDRRPDGSLYTMVCPNTTDFDSWCARNIKRRYWKSGNIVVMEKRSDYIISLLSGLFREITDNEYK